jgi:hypothetical protein
MSWRNITLPSSGSKSKPRKKPVWRRHKLSSACCLRHAAFLLNVSFVSLLMWRFSPLSNNILSRVYGSVTNNNGGWIGSWVYWHLLVQSLVIAINYNNSQSIFSRTVLPWPPRTRSILVLRLTRFWFTNECILIWTAGYIVQGRTPRKTPSLNS